FRPEVGTLQCLSAIELALGERQLRGPALERRIGLSEPDLVGAWVDGEEEIAFVDDVSILEINPRQCPTDLGAQLDPLDRRKLTEESQSRINFAHERLAHDYLWKGRGSSRDGRVAPTRRISEPCSRDDGDGHTQAGRTSDQQSCLGHLRVSAEKMPALLTRWSIDPKVPIAACATFSAVAP